VVWRVQKIGHVCLGVVSFLNGEYPCKLHAVGIFLIQMVFLSPMGNERSTPASISTSPRCFEGSLVVFDSGACVSLAMKTSLWYATSLQVTLFCRASTKL